ncbi:Uncharacterised protein [Collinsella sp. AK_207A]|uniref:hypothetical protein n=1 Tax=Collinsella sp. AK_207A TaxID=2650472 RepID=UPI0012606BC2|nr:hypothetical protein [Collinsella sp. AK_207A]VWL90537.1 Uncharacterised protein [Collinsella sp. AK_207A]
MSLVLVLFIACLCLAFIIMALALMGAVVGLALKLLPVALIVVAVLFFMHGGRVNIDLHLPERWKKK